MESPYRSQHLFNAESELDSQKRSYGQERREKRKERKVKRLPLRPSLGSVIAAWVSMLLRDSSAAGSLGGRNSYTRGRVSLK